MVTLAVSLQLLAASRPPPFPEPKLHSIVILMQVAE